MKHIVFAAIALMSTLGAGEKPDKGKVRVHVVARTTDAEGQEKPNAKELQDSANDIKKRIEKMKWVDVEEDSAKAEMLFEILDQAEDEVKGFVLRYRLTAGTFEAEDDYGAVGVIEDAGGGRPHFDARGGEIPMVAGMAKSGRQTYQSWKAIADGMARTLNDFAEKNYGRLMALRKGKNRESLGSV